MQRLRRFIALTGLAALTCAFGGSTARADLLHSSTEPQKYPDIIANLGKGVSYTYDPSVQQGVFHLKNTAYVLVTGTGSGDEVDIEPTADGSRYQVLNVTLDKNGNYVNDPGNQYQLYGSVSKDGQTYSGLLLSGTPIDFASSNANGVTQFQSDLKLDGKGALASFYGPNSYIHLVAETGNNFTGGWQQDFTISKVSSNTHGSSVTPQPFPVPEPTTMVIVAAGGMGMLYRNRKRLAAR